MKDNRFLSSDIEPVTDSHTSSLKPRAIELIRHELVNDRKLQDEATAAILSRFDDMGEGAFLNLICTFSRILDALEKKNTFREMVAHLTGLLRIGIHKISDEALDAVTIRRDAIQVDIDGRKTLLGTMNGELLTILSMGKESRSTEQRLRAVEAVAKEVGDESLMAISRTFKLPAKDTEAITRLIRNLFDERGHFIRKAFEVALNELVRYGNHAFELLWCYSKRLEERANRIALLNALQHLISRIKRPKHALRFLLADFCRYPDGVQFSDRNAIMLANLLLRTYNKELDVGIEMTPEEVLNVRNGLDKDMVHYAQFRIDTVEPRFATKVRTIHENMIARLTVPHPLKPGASIRQLLFLEREIYIFLALLSGKTAHSILLSALNEYGHPHAGIYRHPKSATFLPVFLQQLKIVARGLGRLGNPDDVGPLRQIRTYGNQMVELYGTQENRQALERTMRGIDSAMRSIAMSDPDSA